MKIIIWTLISFFILTFNKQEEFFFGKYKKPILLQKLENYQESGKADWENLNFYISYDKPYSSTPIDVIPFAYTGYAGLHFGFLTDFGFIDNLENAPIVSISPTDDPPIQLIAPNLEKFLSYVCYAENAPLLANSYDDEEGFELFKNEEIYSAPEFLTKLKHTVEIIHDDFDILKINGDLVSRMNKDKKERAMLKTFKTFDGIGVQMPSGQPITEFSYSFDPNEVENFLKGANESSRIVFYRNASLVYVLGMEYSPKITPIIVKYLKKDGFYKEAKLLAMLK